MTISVIIPAFNVAAFIEQALKTVISQDWPIDEILVINDGSTDRDYAELSGLAPNVHVVDQPNLGVSAARNRGCQLASGEYVAILDGDDVWLPGKLRRQMTHLLNNPGCDAIYYSDGPRWYANPDGVTWPAPEDVADPVPADATVRQVAYPEFLLGLPTASGSMVVKRKVWLELGGFDEARRYGEDQDFNLRLAARHRVDVVMAAGVLYRKHPGSATRRLQDPNHWADVISAATARLDAEDSALGTVDPARLRRRLSELHHFHGYQHFWRGDIGVARREFRRALVYRPLSAKAALYLGLTKMPLVTTLLRRTFTRG
jgi:glycosyltransferase involved in cell wall biosynthesis